MRVVNYLESKDAQTKDLFEEVLAIMKLTTPDFIERFLKDPNEKNKLTFTQYVLRMSYRPTPFGLLAGVSTGKIAKGIIFRPKDRSQWRVFYSDHGSDVLKKLHEQTISNSENYIINPLLRIEKNVIKVPGIKFDELKQIQSYPLMEYVAGTKLIEGIKKYSKTSFSLSQLNSTFNEGEINHLKSTQIILPFVDYFNYFQKNPLHWHSLQISSLNFHKLKNKNIILSPEFEQCEIDQQTVNNVAKAIITMHELFSGMLMQNNSLKLTGRINNELNNRKIFHQIPLSEALDPKTGFVDLKDKRFDKEVMLQRNAINLIKFYLGKINSNHERMEEWNLTIEDVEKIKSICSLEQARISKLPSSILSLLSILPKGRVYLKNVFGMPSAKFLSRFSITSKTLEEGLDDIAKWDSENNKNVILAEIIDWPENINVASFGQRRITTDYVLPIHHPIKDWPIEKQILMSDLYVSSQYGRIRLISKRLDKEIIPLFSNPSNLESDVNPYLTFLSELASARNFSILNWMWSDLREGPYIPRVRLGNVYLSLRAWRFTNDQYKKLKSAKDIVAVFLELKSSLGIPDVFYWVEYGDLKQFVDCSLPLALKSFLASYCNSDHAETSFIKEYIEGMDKEIMLPYKNLAAVEQDPLKNLVFDSKTTIGHNYIYFKCYMNSQQWDHFIGNELHHFLESRNVNSLIKSWFFIKYFDPSGHVRVRLLLKNKKDRAILLEEISRFEEKLINEQILWKFQIETYVRDEQVNSAVIFDRIEECYHLDSLRVKDLIINLGLSHWTTKERIRYALNLMNFYISMKYQTIDEKIFVVGKARFAYKLMGHPPTNNTKILLKEVINDNLDLAMHFDEFIHNHCEEYLGVVPENLGLIPDFNIIQRLIHLALNRTFSDITYLDEDMYYEALFRIYTVSRHTHEK